MDALVSIILPNYNHAIYLQDRLDSIFNQTYKSFEVIILDDCSTDNSLDVLNTYRNHPKVSHFIVNTHNSGSPFLQWQKGLQLAKGHFIWIAESDDFCDLNFLKTHVQILETADVAVAKTMAFVNDDKRHELKHPIFEENKQENALLFCPILNVSSVLFKSSLLKNLKNAEYSKFKIIGDRVFYYECFRDSQVVFNGVTTNYFRQSSSSISKLNNRSLTYYKSYFNEHSQFVLYAKNSDSKLSKDMVQLYLRKFYNRVRDRVPKNKKNTIAYWRLFFNYKMKQLTY